MLNILDKLWHKETPEEKQQRLLQEQQQEQMKASGMQKPVDPEKVPKFNDALDLLNPNFTPAQKIAGAVSLPFNPILHPLETVKGVFETYSKIATIPLAAYSGNLDRVKGIIQGTDDFSGKDVINQVAGGEVHGVLSSLAGFGLDVASDPFIGVARLPEATIRSGNNLIIQAAAPGFPQAINQLGVMTRLQRFAGTGSGTSNDIVAQVTKAYHEGRTSDVPVILKAEENQLQAKQMIAQLKSVEIKSEYNPFIQPSLDGDIILAQDIDKAIPNELQGTKFHADIKQQASYQVEHSEAERKLKDIQKLLNPEELIEENKARAKKTRRKASTSEMLDMLTLQTRDMIDNFGGNETKARIASPDIFEMYDNLKKEHLSVKGITKGFTSTQVLEKFANADNIAEGMRYFKDGVTKSGGSVIGKHSKAKFFAFSKPGTGFTMYEEGYILANNEWVPSHKYKKNPFKYRTDFTTKVDQIKNLMKNPDSFTGQIKINIEHIPNLSTEAKETFKASLVNNMTVKEAMALFEDLNEADHRRLVKVINQQSQNLRKSIIDILDIQAADKDVRAINGYTFSEPTADEIMLELNDMPVKNLLHLGDGNVTEINEIVEGLTARDIQQAPHVATKSPLNKAIKNGWIESTRKGYYKVKKPFTIPTGLRTEFKNRMVFNKQEIRKLLDFMHQDIGGVTRMQILSIDQPHVYDRLVNFMHSATHDQGSTQSAFQEFTDSLGRHRITNTVESSKVQSLEVEHPEWHDSTVDEVFGGAHTDPYNTRQTTMVEELDSYIRNSEMWEMNENGALRSQFADIDSMLPSYAAETLPKELHNTVYTTKFKTGQVIKVKDASTLMNSARFAEDTALFGKEAAWERAMAMDEAASKSKIVTKEGRVPKVSDYKPHDKFTGVFEVWPRSTASGKTESGVEWLKKTYGEEEVKVTITEIDNTVKYPEYDETIDLIATQPERVGMYNLIKDTTYEMVESNVDFPKQAEVLKETIKSDAKAAAFNLGAEQNAMFIGLREGTAKPFKESLDSIRNAMNNIQSHAMYKFEGDMDKANLYAWKVQNSTVRRFYKDHTITIDGGNFVEEILGRNFTMTGDKNVPGLEKSFIQWAENANSQLGEDLFSVTRHERPNSHLVTFELNYNKIDNDKDMLDKLKTWVKDNMKEPKGFTSASFKFNVKQYNPPKGTEHLADLLHEAMINANQELADTMTFARLGDRIRWSSDAFFPHAQKSLTDGVTGVMSRKLVMEENQAIAGLLKRENKFSGAFSSVAHDRSVLGTPFDLNINTGAEKSSLFTTNPLNAYQHTFSSAFAEHENLRIAREVILHDKFALKNMDLIDIPETAVADFDIIVPVRDQQGGLLKFKTYAPTPANIAKYNKDGYMSYKAVSAEARTLLKHENLSATSPAYKWFIKNVISPYKRGVLQTLSFPIGNAGDMAFKTLATKEFKGWSQYSKNVAASNKVFLSHENVLRQYATLRTGEVGSALYDVAPTQFMIDRIHFLEGKKVAPWIEKLDDTSKFKQKLISQIGDTNIIHSEYNSLAFERYSNLSVSTTAQRATYLEEAKTKSAKLVGSKREAKINEFKEWLTSTTEHPVGRVMNKITTRNAIARKISHFNEKLENQMRFSQLAMDLDFSKESIRSTLANKDATYAATQMIKWNHMHFSEMPGEAVWATAIWPFFQFPVKNAVWWANFISKKPHLAAQVDRFKKEMWKDADDDSFWAKLGGMPIGDHTIFKGIPGMGSLSTFGMAVDTPTDLAGSRLNPILRPFLSNNGNKYTSYSISNRTPQKDNMLQALLHGINPLEANIQGGLNFINHPSMVGLAPSVLKKEQESKYPDKKYNKNKQSSHSYNNHKKSYKKDRR